MATDRDFAHMQEVRGLRELQAELRKGGPEMAKRLQAVNKRLVTDVAEKARARVYPNVASVDPTGRVTGGEARHPGKGSLSRTKASIRGVAGQKNARVRGGGPKAPAFYGHEFGGGGRPVTRQFPPHRGREGYFLYPVVRQEVREAAEDWNRIFDDVFP